MDEAHHVRVAELTPAAAFLALTLAQERFPGRPLVANGSDAFKREISEMAEKHEFTVAFANAIGPQGRQAMQSRQPEIR